MRIGNSLVVLPKSANLDGVGMDGGEFRNHITFSDCREYGSESSVRFGDTVEPPPPAKKK